MITVESDTGSSDTGSFSLSDIDSTATHLLEHCQDSTVDFISFPWISSGTVSCDGASVSDVLVEHTSCFYMV